MKFKEVWGSMSIGRRFFANELGNNAAATLLKMDCVGISRIEKKSCIYKNPKT